MKLLGIELCEKINRFKKKKKIYNVDRIKNWSNLSQILKISRCAN